jgi:hypothetical protein
MMYILIRRAQQTMYTQDSRTAQGSIKVSPSEILSHYVALRMISAYLPS